MAKRSKVPRGMEQESVDTTGKACGGKGERGSKTDGVVEPRLCGEEVWSEDWGEQGGWQVMGRAEERAGPHTGAGGGEPAGT